MNEFSLVNGEVLTPGQQLFVDLYVKQGRLSIREIRQGAKRAGVKQIDVSGCFVTPGLIDLQVNGTAACALWADPTEEQFAELCGELLQAGVTAFLPTLITDSPGHMKKGRHFLESMGVGDCQQGGVLCRDQAAALPVKSGRQNLIRKSALPKKSPLRIKGQAIRTLGIHLEGPFLSPDRPGVHPPAFIQNASLSLLKELIGPAVKLVTLAPEQKGGEQAIEFLMERGITVSLGHSNATFAQAQLAFRRGIKMMTHTFNALPPMLPRCPGAVTAALLDDSVLCCIICDGLHVDPHMVELMVRIKGTDGVILVTDVAPIGTSGGGLNGSSIMLSQAVRNLVAWQVASFQEAIKMATINPARAIKMDGELGVIKDSGLADLVVWDKHNLAIKHVVARGELIF